MAEIVLDNGSNGVQLILDVGGVVDASSGGAITASTSSARFSSASLKLRTTGNSISDSSNSSSASGNGVSSVSKGSTSFSLSNYATQTIFSLTPTARPLKFGSTSDTVTVSGSVSNLEYAGGTLSGTYTTTFPRRPYNAPLVPTVDCNATTISYSGSQRTPSSDRYWATFDMQMSTNDGDWVAITMGATANTTSRSWNTSAANNRYRARVRGANADATGGWGYGPYLYSTPTSPGTLTLTRAATGAVLLNWPRNARYRDGHTIYRRKAGASAWSVLTTVNADAYEYIDSTLGPSETAEYYVQVFTPSGSLGRMTANSTTASAAAVYQVPTAPTNQRLVLNASQTVGTVTWAGNVNDAANLQYWSGVRVTLETNATQSSVTLAGTATNWTFVPERDKRYRAIVASVNAAGVSSEKSTEYVYTEQTTPVIVSAVRNTERTTLTVTVTKALWASSTIVETSPDGTTWQVIGSATGAVVTIPLLMEQGIKVRVRTVDPNGGSSAPSAAVDVKAELLTDKSKLPGVVRIYQGGTRVRQVFSHSTRIWSDGS